MANLETGPLKFNLETELGRKLAHEHEVLMSLEGLVADRVTRMTQDPDSSKTWQVSDILPDFGLVKSAQGEYDPIERLIELQVNAGNLSPELLVVQAGNSTTEAGSKHYARALERIPITQTDEGIPKNGWEMWGHKWDSEEDRHNYALDRWIYLSGRYDQREYDKIRQKFLIAGFKPGIGYSPYRGVQYPAFQEPATVISHGNTGLLARDEGDPILYKADWTIRGDEIRHKVFYRDTGKDIMSVDPWGFTISYAQMLKDGVTMPAALMHNEAAPPTRDRSQLFDDYAALTSMRGIYTAYHYYEIAESLIEQWGILEASLGETGEAADAQEYLGNNFTKEIGLEKDARMQAMIKRRYADKPVEFPWLPGQLIDISKIKRLDFAA